VKLVLLPLCFGQIVRDLEGGGTRLAGSSLAQAPQQQLG
jgi:hypothetical protein